MNRAVLTVFAPALVASALGCREAPSTPIAPRPVRTVTVAIANGSDTVVQTGDVQPRRETDLALQIEGRIARRLVEVGAAVARGQILARLDDGLVQNEVRAAQAELTSTAAALELARGNLARQDKLFAAQSASAQQIDEATAAVRSAIARNDVAAAAALNARRKLGYTTLVAPEDGVVTAVGANPGQVVAPGQMVVRVATQERDAVFTISDRIVAATSRDVKIRVQLVSDPAVAVVGAVREVSPAADPVTRTYRVRVALPGTAPMPLGASVTGTVELPAEPVVALPASALTSDGNGPAVFVVDLATEQLRRRAVTVARYGDDRVVIASGLHNGDRVVTAGVSKLRPGQRVALAERGTEK